MEPPTIVAECGCQYAVVLSESGLTEMVLDLIAPCEAHS